MNTLEGSVHRVLTGTHIGQMRPFNIGANQVDVGLYSRLLKKFETAQLPLVKWYPDLLTSGQYEPAANTLWFKFSSAQTPEQKAIVLHEITHAALDLENGKKMVIGDAEALAYVAQCMYYHLITGKNSVLVGDVAGSPKDLVFKYANELAIRLLDWETLKYDDWFQLRQAVSNDPDYYWEFFTTAEYDGM